MVNEAVKKGYLKTIPYQKNIHPYFKEADCIVHPSYHEGMSNVLMEAAATGRPAITTNISGCREIIEKDVSGFLCEPRSKESLCEAADRFVSLSPESRKAMGEAARRVAEQKFDRRSIILTYVNEIKELLR